MRYILIVLFLVSFGSVSMGGVGDVYFCRVVQSTYMYSDPNNSTIKIFNNDIGKTFKLKWMKNTFY